MNRKTTWIVSGALVVAVLSGGGAAAATGQTEAPDRPEAPDQQITGTALDQASAAALKETGGGRVTDTEVGDEEGYYEVEVTLDDGRQVDVHLDERFTVIGQQADEGRPGDQDGA
ncbi:MAG: PepSY domain-containing protein [Egibacteraceae bacterium]